ncbi:gas vesicle protein [Streptomyces sp. SID8379]|uniref:GvpL/GvpF family gas vesicle protein n=1 Tax=unclassified Streptomyces TaxID=2593676 RepID=UPI000477B07E|nr:MULTISPECIES: GvpL/GvpF family gas vesicle protein [unclassified Streptomyces]MYW66899.1 gas vesicle protein [Streptomyces sp. SID8379]
MDDLRYVYAVCRPLTAPLQAELVGAAGTRPRQLEHDGLVAVVAHVPERDFAEAPPRAHLEDLEWLAVTARAHQNVIAALATVTGPLPLRLATVIRDDSGVRAMPEQEGARFRAGLDRLAGRLEWGVKVYADQADPEKATGSAASGRDYLRRRRAERTAGEAALRRAERFSQQLHEGLTGSSVATRTHTPQSPELARTEGRNILNASYLVDREAAEQFGEQVGALKNGEPGLRVELTGPWAGYSFTDMAGDNGEEAR